MTAPALHPVNTPVIVDAYDGPLKGMVVGTRDTRNAYAPNRTYLRVRVTETAQGYTYGDVIDALPERVAVDESTARAIAIAENMATRPRMTLARAEREYRNF